MVKQLHLIASLFIYFISVPFISAQTFPQELMEKLGNYSSIGKEVAYLHLNKSLFLHGEQLGFTAYVLHKKSLRPSKPTSNLYVQLRDANQEIVMEEMLLVENGIATGVFNIEPKFLPGNYTITAFTNWMRNFDEQNYFTETIRILESNLDVAVKQSGLLNNIDAQFLPESGHLVNDIVNQVGIIAKDNFGYGLPNAKVIISEYRGANIATVELNQFGIGKFSFTPNINERYTALISHNGKEFPVDFNQRVEEKGIILTAVKRYSKLRLAVSTNAESLPGLRNKSLVLLIQGKSSIQDHLIKFDEEISIPLEFDLGGLETGMNILTLIDENNRPIAERLFFNYVGLPIEGIQKSEISKNRGDSLEVSFSFKETKERNLSVSILPQNTISHNRNHSILSYNLLQPFLRGAIENGGWYFMEITDRKKYELDNLLITQGWSSYDWEKIFTSTLALEHRFEENIEFKAAVDRNIFTNTDLQFMVHATSKNQPEFLNVFGDQDSLTMKRFMPVDGEKLSISRMKKNNSLVPAELQVQFFPNQIPDFHPVSAVLNQVPMVVTRTGNAFNPVYVDDFLQDAEDLGEVLLTAVIDKEKERERRLGSHSYGKVSVITELDLMKYYSLADFLRSKNFIVTEEMGTIIINSSLSGVTGGVFNATRQAGDEPGVPADSSDPSKKIAIYLDDMYMADHSMFYNYPLRTIDYIEINLRGMGGGLKDAKGSIRIYSDLTMRHTQNNNRNRIQEFEIPLTYARDKRYYTPQYDNTNDSFFQQYGVIDWKPNLRSRNGEEIIFQIKSPEVDFKMIIEGISEDGTLIHEITTFQVAD